MARRDDNICSSLRGFAFDRTFHVLLVRLHEGVIRLGLREGVDGSFELWAHSRFPHVLEAIGHAWMVTKITRDRGYSPHYYAIVGRAG